MHLPLFAALVNVRFGFSTAVLHSEFVLSNILKQTIEYEPYTIGYN